MVGKLPTFLVIGAMKAGTSSFHNYLQHHPGIFMSAIKELDFFLTSINYSKGLNWYKSHFVTEMSIRGETSPNYSKYPYTASLVSRYLPDIKLFYLIRDPMERLFSELRHYNMDPNTFVSKYLLSGKSHVALDTGMYYTQLSRYLEYFPKERIHVVSNHNLLNKGMEEMNKAFHFLNLKELTERDIDLSVKKNESVIKTRAGKIIRFLNRSFAYRKMKTLTGSVLDKPLGRPLRTIHHKIFYHPTKNFQISEKIRQQVKDYYREEMRNFKLHFGNFPDLDAY